jgi:hypothetical protein
MTDTEFEILDALYFIVSFEELKAELGYSEGSLKKELLSLIDKGWVKMMERISDIEIRDRKEFEFHYKNYNYLATKDGLFAHNSK